MDDSVQRHTRWMCMRQNDESNRLASLVLSVLGKRIAKAPHVRIASASAKDRGRGYTTQALSTGTAAALSSVSPSFALELRLQSQARHQQQQQQQQMHACTPRDPNQITLCTHSRVLVKEREGSDGEKKRSKARERGAKQKEGRKEETQSKMDAK